MYMYVCTCTCSTTVEPLYCGHLWAKKICPHYIIYTYYREVILISEVDLYTKSMYTINWELRNCPLIKSSSTVYIHVHACPYLKIALHARTCTYMYICKCMQETVGSVATLLHAQHLLELARHFCYRHTIPHTNTLTSCYRTHDDDDSTCSVRT